MYNLVFTSRFVKSAKFLDKKLKLKLKLGLDVLLNNPFHPALHSKLLSGHLAKNYSFRLGGDYRVIFRFTSSDVIYLIKVGHRKDIYK